MPFSQCPAPFKAVPFRYRGRNKPPGKSRASVSRESITHVGVPEQENHTPRSLGSASGHSREKLGDLWILQSERNELTFKLTTIKEG